MCVYVLTWKPMMGRYHGKTGVMGGGDSPGSCNPWQCSSIRESIGEIMAEVSLIAVKPLATVIEEIV